MFLKTRFPKAVALTALAWLLAQAPARAADYIVGIGDVLTLAVPGLSIDRKMSVGVDGRIAVPLIGDIEASGKTLSQLRDAIRQVLPTKIFTQRLTDGREIGTVISADEISLFVSEYRPVFVMGDVTGPGEKIFRPGMIVQQLVSMSGGFNLAQFRLENPYLSLADYRSDYDAVWSDVIKLRARIGWLRNALASPALPADETVQKSPLSAALTNQTAQLQENELEARAERFKKERQGLETVAKRIAERVVVLDRQREKEEEGAEFDASEERRIKDLVRSGNAAANRGAEVRRLGLLSATRALQVGSQAEAERKSYAETLNQIENLSSEYKISLSSELQTLSLELSKAVSRRESVWEKMVYAGAARSKLNANQPEQIKFTINRNVDGRQVQIDATAGSEILPGDVVQVQLNLNDLIGTP